jgi:hypothetical protein
VLTKAEPERLRDGIAETVLPGSATLKELIERSKTDPKQKDFWIVKPVRDAGCVGIKLGEDITQDEWFNLLEEQSERRPRLTECAFVVQRLVKHVWFDIVRHDVESSEPESSI